MNTLHQQQILQLKKLEARFKRSLFRQIMHALFLRFWLFSKRSGYLFKRAIDIVIASAALITLAPLMLIVCVLIKLTDRGPVLFWQTRIGKWGKPFHFPKFRSMVVNAETIQQRIITQNHHGECVTFKMRHDPRITWIGRFIRKTSIDELPQLWCVLKGDMSLVGPRPALVREVAQYTLDDRRRLDVTPGITCIWQVTGRADIPFDQQVELDMQYIQEQSLWTDLKLLLKTIPAVISGRGAY